MNEVRLPLTMQATVSYGDTPPEPLPDQLPPGWVRIPISFEVPLPADVLDGAKQCRPSAGAGQGSQTAVSIVPNSVRLGAEAGAQGGRRWMDLGALVEALQDDPSPPGFIAAGEGEPGPQPSAPGKRSAEAFVARSVPLAAGYGSRSTGRFDRKRLARIDMNALGLADTWHSRSAARPGAPFVRAPYARPAPAAEDDFPVLPGGMPSSGTGSRVLDILMRPAARLPPAVGAVLGAAGGSRAKQGSATSAGTSGTGVNGDVLAMLQGMQEAERSPLPSGSVEVAQVGGSDAATLPRAGSKSATVPQHGHPSATSVPPAPLKISSAGLVFIEKEEERPGVSNNLHHPSAASGVTLGPGYDMKEKSATQIVTDLKRIGLVTEIAKTISGASHLTSSKADKFIKDNKSLTDLSSEQQAHLLALTIGPYEDKVRRDITVPLKPYQFDALVSFVYNIESLPKLVRDAVNEGDFQAAALVMKKYDKSGDKVLDTLKKRRQREIDLLLHGNYGKKE